MVFGLLTAVLVSLIWIVVQIAWMHFDPVENRIRAMTIGYLLSLPFVYIGYHYLPFIEYLGDVCVGEAWALGLLNAYFLHLLIFLLYVECFYHVERAVTLRILIEIMEYPEQDVPLQFITGHYNVKDMISARMAVLEAHHFIKETPSGYVLLRKGRLFAILMLISVWIFQSKPQSERV